MHQQNVAHTLKDSRWKNSTPSVQISKLLYFEGWNEKQLSQCISKIKVVFKKIWQILNIVIKMESLNTSAAKNKHAECVWI